MVKVLQRSHALALWHDHSTIPGSGYILITVHVLYDMAVLKSSDEVLKFQSCCIQQKINTLQNQFCICIIAVGFIMSSAKFYLQIPMNESPLSYQNVFGIYLHSLANHAPQQFEIVSMLKVCEYRKQRPYVSASKKNSMLAQPIGSQRI